MIAGPNDKVLTKQPDMYISGQFFSINKVVGLNTHLQLTQWSFGVKVIIWQIATSTQKTIVSNASVW